MTVKASPDPRLQFSDINGPIAGGKLFTYLAGTTTKLVTYTNSTGSSSNTNPIILDANGRTPYGVWLVSGSLYKFVLSNSTDTDPPTSPIFTEDNLSGVNDGTASASQWQSSGVVPTYISATQFSLTGDQTAAFEVGRRVQAQVTAGTITGTITVSAFTTLTTITVLWDSGQALDSGLSVVNLGIITITGTAFPIFTHSQLFTSNGSFTVPPGVKTLYVSGASGGGGGGGGGSCNSTTQAASGAGGGAAGQCCYKLVATNQTPGTVYTVVIGAGGTGGAGGTSGNEDAGTGTAGGNTTVAGLIPTLFGGAGGVGGLKAGATPILGSLGGAGTSAADGQRGSNGGTITSTISYPGFSGSGGSSMYGGGGFGQVHLNSAAGAATAGTVGGSASGSFGSAATSGAGGGGGASKAGVAAAAGGNGGPGANGFILIEW